ncbi:TPA: hypothetical protein DIS55_01130 [Candidatus Kaiserbacteria bacterium]|uniref:DUF192 domain-containing protein n=1 Tax=Candidatus Kaiserbacteria bacterium RIFCSPLOWO2_12_FULL_50_28 TaxID=1798527 RepID=A0A1F6FPX7_9BACT|nr:MAG: hypothetical protein A3H15_00045 [Candidatus Kaiserbacteria bacterium RIFCSPLOWO2_12_FULL_50_28]HCM43539.1 hypothetical protein [Candidatus Kaiserbacteria bacterium]
MSNFVRYAFMLAACLIVAGVAFFWFQWDFPASKEVSFAKIGDQTVRVTVADTPESRERGLSGRDGLASDEGMLFVFQNDGYHTFWMKDMLFSIDIIWLSHEGTVVDIAKDVSPDTFPMSFSPRAFARYVLELPARFVEEYTIQIGDEVRF